MNSGDLVPIFFDEILPGDTVNLTPAFFARLATPFKPFMDTLHFDWQFFYCPTRLLWVNFVRMMGEQIDPADHIDYTVPQVTAQGTGYSQGDLGDYFGLPIDLAGLSTSAYPFRMYNLCYKEWYRDENLQDSPFTQTSDASTSSVNYPVLKRNKRKDYFSGSLPFAQKGDPVLLPLGSTAPLGGTVAIVPGDPVSRPSFNVGGTPGLGLTHSLNNGVDYLNAGDTTQTGPATWNAPALDADLSAAFADLSSATSATINEMRVAIGVQHLLERDARGGTRYRELVLSHFGVHTDDIRLMRPELLATGSMQINPNAIAQTAPDGATTELGDLGAFATGESVGRGFNRSFQEHGYIMGFVSVRAELLYQQGLERMHSRLTRYDHYWPDLANLGEQAVLSKEIYMDLAAEDDDVWGYQPRYEEYRHRQSRATGQFRSQATLPLDVWHLGLDFASRPTLDDAFIQEAPPVARVVIVPSEPEFLVDAHFKVTHVRAMPKYSTPGLLRF